MISAMANARVFNGKRAIYDQTVVLDGAHVRAICDAVVKGYRDGGSDCE